VGIGPGGSNQPVLQNRAIPVYICPSDVNYDDPHSYTTQNMYTINTSSRVSYGFVHELTEYDGYAGQLWSRNLNATRSAFGINASARIADIADGTSTTMLLIETPFKKCSSAFGPFFAAYTHTHFVIPYYYGINLPWSGCNGLPYAWAAGSLHAGGCHALLGDGAVRFISQNIYNSTVLALTSIKGAELMGEF
jgi:hypothetical protein